MREIRVKLQCIVANAIVEMTDFPHSPGIRVHVRASSMHVRVRRKYFARYTFEFSFNRAKITYYRWPGIFPFSTKNLPSFDSLGTENLSILRNWAKSQKYHKAENFRSRH